MKFNIERSKRKGKDRRSLCLVDEDIILIVWVYDSVLGVLYFALNIHQGIKVFKAKYFVC